MTKARKQPAHVGILWEGPSPLDGAPLVAIATAGSKNEKTGDMVQVWILRQDIAPNEAVKTGQDQSICGFCPLRSPEGFKGRACYVQVAQGPLSVWKAYKRGVYRQIDTVTPFRGLAVRWGAYGDPAMLPHYIVEHVNSVARNHTGYTHQWRQPWAAWTRGAFMASVETAEQERRALDLGWGTFRAGLADGSDKGSALTCKNELDGTTCADCGACDGQRLAIYIPAHGAGKNLVPAAKLARKKVAHV